MTVTTETRQAVLGLSGIVKTFPGVKALKDVSFDVLPGEVHALLGENGAGKSTLMGVAAGSIVPDEGTITIGGRPVQHWSPVTARAEGVAIVYQHPALLPDLTVRENLAIALSSKLGEIDGDPDAWMRGQLERVGCSARLKARVSELTVAQRQLLELAKALALEPKVLILDEPTAPLGADMVERVFAEVREAAGRGVAVVYISHRLPEVRQIAHRVSVMRDGELRSTAPIDAISDEEILQLIVGRTVETAFPPKATPDMLGEPERGLRVEGLNSEGFHDVSLTVRPGEIVGLAGIAGNGQSEFLRALAGLEPASGEARLAGEPLPLGRPHSSHRAGVAFLPADRHEEGLEMGLSVRENAALGALSRFSSYGVVRAEREREAVEQLREELKIRTASLETPVSSLSGGNQQKIVLARALLEEPKLLLADEPTQGVDAGARVEMYRNLRDIASSGIPVLVTSSDSLELEGLCDRVLVFSRGHVVAELVGDDVTEEQLAKAIVTATTHRKQESAPQESALSGRLKQLRRSAGGDYTPAAILLAVVLVFGLYSWSVNELVLSSFNITSALTLLAALAFISLGQLCVVMTGGIDISVGPLAGLNVVIASFFVVDGKPGLVIVAGFAIMLAASLLVGLLNGSMVRFLGFTSIAATLTTYIALQGASLLLRPQQGGFIKTDVTNVIQTTVGIVPVAFLVAVALGLVLEWCLRRTRWGLNIRAVGSREQAAHRVGVRVDRSVIGAYVACSALTFLGGVMLMAQIGVGSATQGVSYTLTSITAVVLGGASLLGGRGSFIGAMLGALLIQQVINATTFLELSQAWQYWLTGLLTLVAAAIYTQARSRESRL